MAFRHFLLMDKIVAFFLICVLQICDSLSFSGKKQANDLRYSSFMSWLKRVKWINISKRYTFCLKNFNLPPVLHEILTQFRILLLDRFSELTALIRLWTDKQLHSFISSLHPLLYTKIRMRLSIPRRYRNMRESSLNQIKTQRYVFQC